ncbi:MAG TPA: 1,4-dihydroxy-6-naphthoate synthase, partial [Flavihumibacter sp.]|nr:1,4-dihydroxy-6-naphthoate synthase [Flavihumibacter sp.]
MLLTLGFSPCPNDTFIFDALVNKHIDPGPFQFELALEDVQTLNEWALQDKLDISKISYGVWPLVKNKYRLLESGGALGNGCGPLLIAREPIAENKVNELRIAIPGRNTTAHLLFSMVYPQARNKVFMVFNEIEQALLDGQVDAGVIIHENRFTYAARGLV